MSKSRKSVECGTHGQAPATYMCQHLGHDMEKLGFNIGRDPDDPDNPYPDAWCNECKKILDAEGDWNDSSMAFADIKLVCALCYDDIRSLNWLQDNEDWEDLVTASCADMDLRQEKFRQEFKVAEHDSWDRDQDTGLLVFSNDGEPQFEAKFHFAGSLSLKSNTWMWAWANDSFSEKTRVVSRQVREFGDSNRFLPLVAHLSDATQEDAGHFTAIMAKKLDAIGYYRTYEDECWAYMVITSAKWVKKKKLSGLFR